MFQAACIAEAGSPPKTAAVCEDFFDAPFALANDRPRALAWGFAPIRNG
jgi:hypothetical protein